MANWIWLNEEKYPDSWNNCLTFYCDERSKREFKVVSFKKKYEFDKKLKKIILCVGGDVRYHLYINGSFVQTGPVPPGADNSFKGMMPRYFLSKMELDCGGKELDFSALVHDTATREFDSSSGHCGFYLEATVLFEDGSIEIIGTDESWLSRYDDRYVNVTTFDALKKSEDFLPSICFEYPVRTEISPLKPLVYEDVFPIGGFEPFTVKAEEKVSKKYRLDKVYGGYFVIDAEGDGEYIITVDAFEKEGKLTRTEKITADGGLAYRSIEMSSCSGFTLTVENKSEGKVRLNRLLYSFSHYPCSERGSFKCSDEALNTVYEMGKHALKICKQNLELDSPMHQENLACSGDYMISSLMNYMTYGNAEVTKLDIERIADFLRLQDGYMFHSTYTFLWMKMALDYCMFTGDLSILENVIDACEVVYARFETYKDEKGLIDNPPSYAFVDWMVVDGFSLHHPPKALGQTALCMFYCYGFEAASKMCTLYGDEKKAKKYIDSKNQMADAINKYLYDENEDLYCEGTPDTSDGKNWMLPANVDKKYFGQHSNILSVMSGVCPKEKREEMLTRMVYDKELTPVQPYFAHFLLEAIREEGLFEKYGIQVLSRWKYMAEFPKGLPEGWYDCSGYGFDYSHVWAGTPTYQLPAGLLGLEILSAGFKKIKLSPCLCGLDEVHICIPTPLGAIKADMVKGREPEIFVPEGIETVK